MLEGVEPLARAGAAIHWLHPKSKRPIGNDWSDKPVATIEKLRRTFRNGNNVGIRFGQWSCIGGNYLHLIDLDIRNPAYVAEAKRRLEELFPGYTEFPCVQSGSGGESRHYYILSERSFPSRKLAHSREKMLGADGKHHWAWEIELFGTGKQAVIPPSIHPDTGRPYRWIKPLDLEWLEFGLGPFVRASAIEKIGERTRQPDIPDSERNQPLGISIEQAKKILWDLPADQWREDRDGWLTAGMALHHEFDGSIEAFEMWCDFSSPSNKFDRKDQKRVWKSFKGKEKPVRMATLKNAAREAQLEQEFENLDDGFDEDDEDPNQNALDDEFDDLLGAAPAETKDKPEPVSKRQQKLNKADVEAQFGRVPPRVAKLNAKHAVAFVNGKTVIITENKDGSVAYGSVGDLHNFYENDRVATDKATEPVTKAWMRHKLRREFPNGIVFAPGRDVEGAYNHWRGFSVKPDPKGSCTLFLAHLRRVVCSNDDVAYHYAIGWLAHMIQRPGEKPGVAMVLRGKKGAGKDTIGDYVGSLFAQHHVKIGQKEHLIGRFNMHQERCLLLHVEESYWAGNKGDDGPLKFLITSEKVLIEPKGVNAFHVDSVLRLFMSSNEDWVVPATNDERRYFVLDVDDSRRGDRKYFRAIRHEMTHGGRAALLHHLLNYDLSNFDVRDVPNTEGLAQQKVQGLKNIERWWFDMLESGEMPGLDVMSRNFSRVGDWTAETVAVDRDDFRDNYSRWLRKRRFDGEELAYIQFGHRLRLMLPSLTGQQPRKDGTRIRTYVFPDLETCRKEFSKWMQSELKWLNGPIIEHEPDTDDDDDQDDFDI